MYTKNPVGFYSSLAVVWYWWTKCLLAARTQLQVSFHPKGIQLVSSEHYSTIQTKTWRRLRDLLQQHTTDLDRRSGVDTPVGDQTSDQSIFFSLACSEDSYCHRYTQMHSHKQITQTLSCSSDANKNLKSGCSVFKYLSLMMVTA